ncbi:MAG TPA: GIY-YIG nuclease family protein [Thiohalobacter sp.]|nr:GIY-YIG nuclease family protein [Thiohalobacter sp.]
MKFSKTTKERLQFYVYGLVDPRDRTIFYVGKASANDRAFNHLKATASESEKSKRISEIRAAQLEPQVEVLRYGLESEEMGGIRF